METERSAFSVTLKRDNIVNLVVCYAGSSMFARIVQESELDLCRVDLVGNAECRFSFVRNGGSTAQDARLFAERMLCNQAQARNADLVVIESDIELDDTYILDATL